MRRLIMLTGIAAAALLIAACSKKDGGTTATTGVTCAAGQVIDSAGRCLNRGYCTNPNSGVDPTTGQCVPGTAVGGGSYYNDLRFENSLSVTNTEAFKTLIKDAQNSCATLFWWIGQSNYYSSMMSPSYLDMSVPNVSSDRASIALGLGASAPEYGPMAVLNFTGVVYDINTTQSTPGLEIQADGNLGSCSWNAVGNNGLVIRIEKQTFSSQYLDAVISYRGQQFARARLYAY